MSIRKPIASIYKPHMLMSNGADSPMTAAEEVLVYLLIEVIGVPDDVGYSPNQAKEIIERRLDASRDVKLESGWITHPTLERLDEFAERAEIQTVTRFMDFTGGLHKTKFEACEEHIVGVRKRLQLAASTLTIQDPDRMIQLFNWIKDWKTVSSAYKAWLESTQVHTKDETDDEEEE